MIPLMREIITKLKYRRKRVDMTQRDVSKKTGFDASYISFVESFQRVPTLETLEIIANSLGIKIVLEIKDLD